MSPKLWYFSLINWVKDTKRIRNIEKAFLAQLHATFLHEKWFSPFQDSPSRDVVFPIPGSPFTRMFQVDFTLILLEMCSDVTFPTKQLSFFRNFLLFWFILFLFDLLCVTSGNYNFQVSWSREKNWVSYMETWNK